jgi:hypothetical protein
MVASRLINSSNCSLGSRFIDDSQFDFVRLVSELVYISPNVLVSSVQV